MQSGILELIMFINLYLYSNLIGLKINLFDLFMEKIEQIIIIAFMLDLDNCTLNSFFFIFIENNFIKIFSFLERLNLLK